MLYEFGRGVALGAIRDWSPSGVPESLARELPAERGPQLFRDWFIGPEY